MAQPATNAKIEELRFKLKTDPKSRLFYQLAEELRKAGQFNEAEQVLRTGLSAYPTYLAAWVSLGRVLRELKKDSDVVEALSKALQLDPGNVVAARLIADSYLALGEKVEAIKKYKLVHALLPADEGLDAQIEALEREIRSESVSAEEASSAPPAPVVEKPVVQFTPSAPLPLEESPFDRTVPPFADAAQILGEEVRDEQETGDAEPMSLAHSESPFEEPVPGFGDAAVEIESAVGIHIAAAPLAAEVAAPVIDELPTVEAQVEAPFEAEPEIKTPETTDVTDTTTMADLYARQGLVEEARHIYEHILARDPGNEDVRAKLDAITPHGNPKIARLEQWLGKVSRKEVGSV